MKKALVVWPVHREDWVRVFKTLTSDFDFTFLSGTFPGEKNFVKDFAKTIYWSDYQSVQAVLESEEAELIIFMSIDSGLSLIMNRVAKKAEIRTFILQHGIYTNYKDYHIREKLWKKKSHATAAKLAQKTGGFSSSQFALQSLKGFERWRLPFILLYTKLAHRIGPYWAARHIPLSLKKPDFYLCFSPYNATIHRETDGASEDEIRYIGSAELEKYIEPEDELIEEPFYLHIDQAFAENSFGEETLTKQNMLDFYFRLNDFCLAKKARLYIKLHPESYNSEWLPQHENITYLKKVEDFSRYIQSARGCFGFYSTIVVPAVYWKSTVLFDILYSGLQEHLKEYGNVEILNFESFLEGAEEINFSDAEPDRTEIRKKFILPDGRMKLVDALKS